MNARNMVALIMGHFSVIPYMSKSVTDQTSLLPLTTRFAPSPNGLLHLGHAYSALVGYHRALSTDGRFLLRIEDIDIHRARAEFEQAIYDDLSWLGLHWQEPVRRQSDHMESYRTALATLTDRGLTYPCFCTRSDIELTITENGPDGPVYPGTCRGLSITERETLLADGNQFSVRLDTKKALAQVSLPLSWMEVGEGMTEANPAIAGDVVLARKDIGTSYHMVVVVDDALQGITQITRGRDLYDATHIHRLLQALLGLPAPDYHHHALVDDESGKKLSKSRGSPSLRSLRENGVTAAEIWRHLGFSVI